MEKKTVHALVSGKVQGVCFREYTRRKAEELGLRGWVKNLPDGRVETLFSGAPAEVDQMTDWLYTGSPYSEVKQVIIKEGANEPTFASFQITY